MTTDFYWKESEFSLIRLGEPRQFTDICTDNENQACLLSIHCQIGGACSSASYKWGSLGPTGRMLSDLGSTFLYDVITIESVCGWNWINLHLRGKKC